MSTPSALPHSTPTAPAQPAAALKEGLVTVLLGLSVILVIMNTMMFNLALPQVSREFGLSSTSTSWIVTGYSIIFAISSITYSRLSDHLPIRRLLTIGLLSFGGASVLGFFSHHFALLLIARLIQASGAAAVPALGIVLITRFVPLTRRGKAMSTIMSASSLGLGLGPVVGGATVQYLGWNYLFVVTGVVLLLIPFFLKLLPKEQAQQGTFDFPGALLIGIGTTGLLLFLTNRLWIVLVIGALALLLFWLRIHRASQPFVQPALFRNKPYMALSALGIVAYINSFAALFLMPQILSHQFGLTAGQSGLVLFPGALLAMLASNQIGKIIDRYGNHGLFRVMPWLLLASAVLFALFAGISFYSILLIYMLLSVSFSALTSSVSNEMSRLLPRDQIGAGMGLFQLTQFFSGAFSVAAAGAAIAWQQGVPYMQAYSHIFWGIACFGAIGLLCAFAYLRSARRSAPAASGH